MDTKIGYSLATNLILGGVLIASWCLGKDGMVTTAIIGLMGANIGTIMGFKLAEKVQ
jgi:hypothetical protein